MPVPGDPAVAGRAAGRKASIRATKRRIEKLPPLRPEELAELRQVLLVHPVETAGAK